MNSQKKIVVPLVIIFIVFSTAINLCKNLLAKWEIDYNILVIANLLFFFINILVFLMQKKALTNSNPNVFIRSVMGGMLIKMFVVIAAIIVYRLVAGSNVSKISVFAAMFLYLFYLAIEVAAISKLNRQNNG